MTPEQMSAVHHAAFAGQRGWSAAEFRDLLENDHVHAFVARGGLALCRSLAGESELLTLAVDPALQRQGIARGLVADWLNTVRPTSQTAFLEVAADNHAARVLYAHFGFTSVATRTGYYLRKNAPSVDALILRCDLTVGQQGQ